MSEENKKIDTVNEADILAKIEKLESMLAETEKARKQGALIGRICMLVMLIALSVFALNLWNFYKDFTSKDNIDKLMAQVQSDMKDLLVSAEMKDIQNKIYKETLPKVTKIFMERFTREIPVFKEKGQAILGNLKTHLETHLKEELTKMLEKSVKDIETDILKKYPNITPEKLHSTLMAAQYVFIEDITEELEQRVIQLADSFDKIDLSLKKYNELKDFKDLEEKELDDVKLELIEALLEFVIYEVNPQKGEKKITIEGGAK